MKLLILIPLLLLLPQNSIGQITLNDSIRTILEKNENVDSIEFDTEWYYNGNKKLEGWFYHTHRYPIDNKDSAIINEPVIVAVGTIYQYYRNGNLRSTHFHSFKDIGLSKLIMYSKKAYITSIWEYRPSDNPPTRSSLFFGNMSNLKKIKAIEHYRNSTQVKYEVNWCGMKFCGNYLSYYKDGTLHSSGQYTTNGKKTGIWKYYDKKGKLKEEKLEE